MVRSTRKINENLPAICPSKQGAVVFRKHILDPTITWVQNMKHERGLNTALRAPVVRFWCGFWGMVRLCVIQILVISSSVRPNYGAKAGKNWQTISIFCLIF